MTVPAQQSSSSASGQQSSSSSSASGQTPTIAHDTVTQGTGVTGLAGVFAERDAEDVARQIAQVVGPSLAENIKEIRVIGDLSALSDITTGRILKGQVEQLKDQIAAYVKSVSSQEESAEQLTGKPAGQSTERPVAKELLLGAGVAAAGNLFGLVTQLIAGTYTYSGQSIPNTSIGGFDILIATKLKPQTIPVCVDRFAAMPAASDILKQIQELASQVAKELNPAINSAASQAAAKAQKVTDDKDRLTELDAEQTALLKDASPDSDKEKKPPAPDKQKDLKDEYDRISRDLPGKSGAAAAAQNLLTQGQALATAISAFITAAMSAPAAGGPPPVARAAHGEALSKPGTALVYAQVIAAGDDQILRQDLIHNTWTNLTGLTAEYALIIPDAGNDAVTFGLKSAYAARHGSIRNGLKNAVRRPLDLQ